MMSSITTKRGPLVLICIALIVAVIGLGIMINNIRNFDNDRLNGTYVGNVNLFGEDMYLVQLQCDGKGGVEGLFSLNSTQESFDGEYVCSGSDIVINLHPNSNMTELVFLGTVDDSNTVLSGEVQLIYHGYTYNGTFFLTKSA